MAGFATVTLGLLAVVVEGLRWEWLLVAVAGTGAVALLVIRRRGTPSRSRARRFVRRVGAPVLTAGGLALVLTAGAAAWALPRPRFADPTRPYRVGTATTQWTDPGRPEPASSDPDDRRVVVAQAWYPAVPGADDTAWYLGRTEGESTAVTHGLADTFGVPRFLLSEIQRARGTAAVAAPVAAGSDRYPVVLFSPGLSGVRTQNTAWATELASHGYVVVALDHPYDSAAVVLDGGQVVTSKVTGTENDAEAIDARTAGPRSGPPTFGSRCPSSTRTWCRDSRCSTDDWTPSGWRWPGTPWVERRRSRRPTRTAGSAPSSTSTGCPAISAPP